MKPKRESREEAAKAGRLHYLSESRCRKCDGQLRYTSTGSCVSCAKRRFRERHKEIKALLEKARADQQGG